MTQSMAALIGAFLFLVLGVVQYLFFKRAVYPAMSERYETQKVEQTQGALSPQMLSNIILAEALLLLPILGYFIGGPIVSVFMGAN